MEPTEPELELIEDADGLELLDDDDDGLELIDDGDAQVQVSCEELTGDAAFDVRLNIAVADMPKPEVAGAIEGPLKAVANHHAALLRWQRVVVEFSGDALISTAAKERVGEILPPLQPLSVTVQRGYPDELVYEGQLPTIQLSSESLPDRSGVRVVVDTGDLADEDLGAALRPEMTTLATTAAGTAVDLCFIGSATPNAQVQEMLQTALIDAGATRLTWTIGRDGAATVLHDRQLQSMVQVGPATTAGADSDITITASDDEQQTGQALALVLPAATAQIGDMDVRVKFAGRPPRPTEIADLLRQAGALAPRSLTLVTEHGDDLLLPALLEINTAEGHCRLRVSPGSRDSAALHTAFCREVVNRDDLDSTAITVDWPQGFELDTETEQACVDHCLLTRHPTSVTYSFGGEAIEPVLPIPLAVAENADGVTCTLNTDAGKPAEMARAIVRRCRAAHDRLAGQSVILDVTGNGALSRTMRNTLLAELTAAGVARAVLSDRGTDDILLPPLLTISASDAGFQVEVNPAGRTPAQTDLAASRELDAADITNGATVQLTPSSANDQVAAALIARGIERLVLNGEQPVQIHPRLFDVENGDGQLTLHAAADLDDDAVLRQVEHELPPILTAASELADVTLAWPGARKPFGSATTRAIELIAAAGPKRLRLANGNRTIQLLPEETRKMVTVIGRRTSSTPPLVMLGVEWCEDEETIAEVESELRGISSDWRGHRVLLIFRDDGVEISAPATHALVIAVRAVLESEAAAILIFRDAPQPHFVTVHSTIDGLSVGAKVGDPRPRPQANP